MEKKIYSFNQDAPALNAERRARLWGSISPTLQITSEFQSRQGVTEFRSATVHCTFLSGSYELKFSDKYQLYGWLQQKFELTFDECEGYFEEMQRRRTIELPYLMFEDWALEVGLKATETTQ